MRDVSITMLNDDVYTYCENTYDRYTFNNGFFNLFLEDELIAAFNTVSIKTIEFIDPEGVVIND